MILPSSPGNDGFSSFCAGAAVHLDHDLVDAGQGHLEDVHIPLLQSLGHDGVVGVGEDLLADVEGLVPAKAALVQQNAHHLGDGEGGVGIVQLDRDLVGQVLQGAVGGQVVLDDIADGSGRQEVLLAQAEDLALNVVVVGVQHLGDELGAWRSCSLRCCSCPERSWTYQNRGPWPATGAALPRPCRRSPAHTYRRGQP